jgi:indole-3-glycerol phosphate synthase
MNKLDKIIAQKKIEVATLQELIAKNKQHPIAKILEMGSNQANTKFKTALTTDKLAIIAEIKRRSPSKGNLAEIADPIKLAEEYAKGGANALSILTDKEFFAGSIEDLSIVAKETTLPILRKDFIIDPLQIAEAVYAGADAILLIVAALGKNTKALLAETKRLGLSALVEVHNEAELNIALESGAEIIGINNRDLTTFIIDTHTALHLGEKTPKNIIKIAESGILHAHLAHTYYQAGFNGVLMGEALVTSADPAAFIRACKHG